MVLLREHGIEPEVIEYLKDPPAKARLDELIHALGGDPHALLRTKEAACKALKLSPASSLKEIVDAIAAHPVLMERPLVVCGGKAALGRPPESVLTIL